MIQRWYKYFTVVISSVVLLVFALFHFDVMDKIFIDKFIVPVSINVVSSALVIVLGFPLLQSFFFEWVKRSKSASLLNFWDLGYTQSVGILYGSQEIPFDENSDPSRALSVFTAMSYNRLQTLINSELCYNTDLNFVDSRDRDAEFWKQELAGNNIVIGGDRSFPILPHIWQALGAAYYQDCRSDPNNRSIRGAGEFRSLLSPDGVPESDACLITRIRPSDSKNGSGATIVISGNYGIGTYAAVEAFCSSGPFTFDKGNMQDVMQFVVSVRRIKDGTHYDRGDVHVSKLWGRNLTTVEWHNAISKATNEYAAEAVEH